MGNKGELVLRRRVHYRRKIHQCGAELDGFIEGRRDTRSIFGMNHLYLPY